MAKSSKDYLQNSDLLDKPPLHPTVYRIIIKCPLEIPRNFLSQIVFDNFDNINNNAMKDTDNMKDRSSRRPKVAASGKFAKFTGKHLCMRLFFNKVSGLRPATLLKKSLLHRCFSLNFEKLPRTSFFTEHLRWLHLERNNQYECRYRKQ